MTLPVIQLEVQRSHINCLPAWSTGVDELVKISRFGDHQIAYLEVRYAWDCEFKCHTAHHHRIDVWRLDLDTTIRVLHIDNLALYKARWQVDCTCQPGGQGSFYQSFVYPCRIDAIDGEG